MNAKCEVKIFRTEFRAEQKITLFCDNNKKKGQFSDLPFFILFGLIVGRINKTSTERRPRFEKDDSQNRPFVLSSSPQHNLRDLRHPHIFYILPLVFCFFLLFWIASCFLFFVLDTHPTSFKTNLATFCSAPTNFTIPTLCPLNRQNDRIHRRSSNPRAA